MWEKQEYVSYMYSSSSSNCPESIIIVLETSFREDLVIASDNCSASVFIIQHISLRKITDTKMLLTVKVYQKSFFKTVEPL